MLFNSLGVYTLLSHHITQNHNRYLLYCNCEQGIEFASKRQLIHCQRLPKAKAKAKGKKAKAKEVSQGPVIFAATAFYP